MDKRFIPAFEERALKRRVTALVLEQAHQAMWHEDEFNALASYEATLLEAGVEVDLQEIFNKLNVEFIDQMASLKREETIWRGLLKAGAN